MKSKLYLRVLGSALTAAVSFAADTSSARRLAEQAEIFKAQGDVEGAKRTLRELIRGQEVPPSTDDLLPLALNRLGSLEQDDAHYREAEVLYRRALQWWEARSDAPTLGLAQVLNSLASLYLELRQPARSEIFRQRSLKIRLELLGPEHPAVALAYSNLAADLYQGGRYKEAEVLCHQALAIWRKTQGGDGQPYRTLNTLALLRLEAHDYEEAIQFAEQASSGARSRQGELSTLHTLAIAYQKTGRLVDADAAFQQALAVAASGRFQNRREKADLLGAYGRFLKKMGRKTESRRIQQQATELAREIERTNGLQYSVDVNAFRSIVKR